MICRTISSVGRAPPLQGGGHWFKPSIVHHHHILRFISLSDIYGRLAQLGEHRPYKAGVTGSSPVSSTILFNCKCADKKFSAVKKDSKVKHLLPFTTRAKSLVQAQYRPPSYLTANVQIKNLAL
jgi:hypothetical protein